MEEPAYYQEVEYVYYPTKNRFQKPVVFRANTLRLPRDVGYVTGEEMKVMHEQMSKELEAQVKVFLQNFLTSGLIENAKLGTEEEPKTESVPAPDSNANPRGYDANIQSKPTYNNPGDYPSEKQYNFLSMLTKTQHLATKRFEFEKAQGWAPNHVYSKYDMKILLDHLTKEREKLGEK